MELNFRLIQLISLASYTDRMVKGLYWFAGLVQLLFILVCSVIGDYLPILARYAGRYTGRIYRFLNRQECQKIISAVDYYVSGFVATQLGTNYPSLTVKIVPAVCVLNTDTIEESPYQLMTRRELISIAKELKLIGYSRMDTDSLRNAISAHR